MTSSGTLGTQLFVGTRPQAKLLRPVANGTHFKPLGGIWTSPYLGAPPYSPWIEWCVEQSFGSGVYEMWLLEPRANVRVLSLDSDADIVHLEQLPGYELVPGRWNIDYEALAQQYDGMRMSASFIHRYRLDYRGRYDMVVYGWDVESTVWFRWVFNKPRALGTATFEFESEWEASA